jgi:hypothetical protein
MTRLGTFLLAWIIEKTIKIKFGKILRKRRFPMNKENLCQCGHPKEIHGSLSDNECCFNSGCLCEKFAPTISSNKEQQIKELAEILEYWRDTIQRNASATTPKELAQTLIEKSFTKRSPVIDEEMLLTDEEIVEKRKITDEQYDAVRESLKDFLPKEFIGLETDRRIRKVQDKNIAKASLAKVQGYINSLENRVKELSKQLIPTDEDTVEVMAKEIYDVWKEAQENHGVECIPYNLLPNNQCEEYRKTVRRAFMPLIKKLRADIETLKGGK